MSAFDSLPTQENLQYIQNLAMAITPELPVSTTNEDYWVVYGSVVVNNLNPKSDIDVLYISSQPLDRPFRYQAYFNDRPVTVYVLTEAIFASDGAEFAFGGYFSGKLLAAHVVLDSNGLPTKNHDEIISTTIGFFMSNFITLNPLASYTRDAVASDVLQAYLLLCPWYDAYLVKFFSGQTDLGKQQLAECLKDNYLQALIAAKLIKQEGENYLVSPKFHESDVESVYRRRIRAVTRFWSYGAIEHDNNHQFADYYFDKANDALVQNDSANVLRSWIVKEFSLENTLKEIGQ